MRRLKQGLMAVGILLVLGTSPPALASIQIGRTSAPNASCPAGLSVLQSGTPADQYTVLAAGIITSWSFVAPATVSPIKFKVGNRVSGNSFEIVGASPLKTPDPGLNTYTDIRVEVEAGDVLGLHVQAEMPCRVAAPPGYDEHQLFFDLMPGFALPWTPAPGMRLDISAQLERDADGDGFGDETQDQCPTAASTQGPCPAPPETTITKGAPNKTDKSKVKFKFTSSEPDSSFDCKVDSKPFRPCTSPKKVKVDEGKHKFKVRAIDAAGNADPSAAKDKFKVVG